jgi:aspartyl-tRNA(Asn)/glutamyl-tRNA(Gln) amidotransferase subunit A
MTDLAFTSAAELARLIAGRAMSPVEVVERVLDRIERSQSVLNAFITVCAEAARTAAKAAEAAVMRGDPLGPLHGVPFAVKDLVNTAGVRTTFGSVALADNIPAADSPAVARLKAAGAILVGKTTTRNSATNASPRRPCSGAPPTPGTCRARRAGRRAARRRRSPPDLGRSASAPTAADRAVSRRRAAASSASSRPWAWCRTT